MEIAVIGRPEFTLGFRLAGIGKVIDVESSESKEADRRFSEIMDSGNTGIIITDQETMETLSQRMREIAETSVRPVTVVVSSEAAAQEALRHMIIKSIGVDLWKE